MAWVSTWENWCRTPKRDDEEIKCIQLGLNPERDQTGWYAKYFTRDSETGELSSKSFLYITENAMRKPYMAKSLIPTNAVVKLITVNSRPLLLYKRCRAQAEDGTVIEIKRLPLQASNVPFIVCESDERFIVATDDVEELCRLRAQRAMTILQNTESQEMRGHLHRTAMANHMIDQMAASDREAFMPDIHDLIHTTRTIRERLFTKDKLYDLLARCERNARDRAHHVLVRDTATGSLALGREVQPVLPFTYGMLGAPKLCDTTTDNVRERWQTPMV